MGEVIQLIPERARRVEIGPGASSAEVVRFASKAERERARLVREARSIYDGIFPPADPPSARQDKLQGGHLATSANSGRGDGVHS